MLENHLYRWFYFLLIISLLFTTCTDGKGFGRGGGGGFKGGSRGSFGGSKGAGTYGGSSSYNRPNNYGGSNNMYKPSSGSSFKKNAMSFGAGALGGVAAYSIMSSMSRSYRPGYYSAGYGTGQTCTNNRDLNGTRFGEFRCPLDGFSLNHKYCCGDTGEQYCCTYDEKSYSGYNRSTRGSYSLFWIGIIIVIIMIAIIVVVKRRRQKDVIMVPVDPPFDEQRPDFYQPPPPPMGYPPPPMNYPPNVNPYEPQPQMNYPPNFNPYAPPPQNYGGNYTPYPPQQQMPYPPQQQPYNQYQVKEGGPPAYNDSMQNNQGMPTTKPM